MNIIVATKNKGKIREIEKIFSDLGVNVKTQEEAGIEIDVEETGDTFEKNALIKARAVAMLTEDIVLADDSGLCVEALDGAPGVYSARYAGDGATDADKIEKLLHNMEGEKKRNAKFVTCVAMVFPDGTEVCAEGEVHGNILNEPAGDNGFGYDPVFYSTELKKSFAEASDEEKNSVSHRGRALRALYDIVKDVINSKGE